MTSALRRAAAVLVLAGLQAAAEADGERGAAVYESHCARCHGPNMVNDGRSFDLRTFPRGERDRFMRSVTQGTRLMPAFRDKIAPDDLAALWQFVSGG